MRLECEVARLQRELVQVREENVRLLYERTIYEQEAAQLRKRLKHLKEIY